MEKETKKSLIRAEIDKGVTDARKIFENIAEQGIVVDISSIHRVKREYDVVQRVLGGTMSRHQTKPTAVSGLDGNPIANKYLQKVESEGGGFLKTAVYDIETTNFFADFGFILTACFKDVDTGEIKVFRLDETPFVKNELDKYKKGEKSLWGNPDFWDVIDIELVDAIRKEFEKYNLVITYNGKWFDEAFIASRLLRCGLPSLAAGVKHLDMLQVARKVVKTRSKKLDSIKNFLKIDDEPDTHNWAEWRMAAAMIKEGFDFIVDHNIKDVEQLHQVAQKLRNHTNFYFF